jgi:hypothetical protein
VALEYLAPTSIVSSSQWTAEDLTWIDDPWLTPNDDVDFMNSFQVAAPIVIRLAYASPVNPPNTLPNISGAHFRIKLLDDIAEFPATIQLFHQGNLLASANHTIANLDGLWHNYSCLNPYGFSIPEGRQVQARLTVKNNGTTRVRVTTSALILDTLPASEQEVPIGHISQSGIRQAYCTRCGFLYYENELTYRNGKLLCTVSTPKTSACYDDKGYKERVNTHPLDLGLKPDSHGYDDWNY